MVVVVVAYFGICSVRSTAVGSIAHTKQSQYETCHCEAGTEYGTDLFVKEKDAPRETGQDNARRPNTYAHGQSRTFDSVHGRHAANQSM